MMSCTKTAHHTKNYLRLLGHNGRSTKERKLQSAVRPENIGRLRKLQSAVRQENIGRLRKLHNAVPQENIARLRKLHGTVRQENIGHLRKLNSTVRQEKSKCNRIGSFDYRKWKFGIFIRSLLQGKTRLSYRHKGSNNTNEQTDKFRSSLT